MVANGYCQRIRSIKMLWPLGQPGDALQHHPHLLLVGIAVAGDGLLYFFGRVLGNGDSFFHCCSNGYALRPSQLQHALYILAKERCLNGKLRRNECLHQLYNFLMNFLEPVVIVLAGGKL